MKRRYKVWVLTVLFLLLATFSVRGEEPNGLWKLKITRCVRPNLVVATACMPDGPQRVRVKLAGLSLPFEDEAIYRQALSRLRELTLGQEVYFDFALGYSLEGSPWVGYIYLGQPSQETTVIVNALLLREGLATLDVDTAGKNMLGYLTDMQEEAKRENLGIWKGKPKDRNKRQEECPSCVIR